MFVKKISQVYYKYNPDGKTYFKPSVCECCGQPYIEEVGVFNKDDKWLGNEEIGISISGLGSCDVYRTSKGLFRSVKACERYMRKQNNG